MAKKYPYMDRRLRSLPGERWKDIPALEGYYKISNLGRIKRMEYKAIYRNGAIYVKPEKIIKPFINKQFNIVKRDYKYFLVNRVAIGGVRYNFSIARLVYHSFVDSKFKLKDKRTVIFYKDEDSFNIRPSNLITADLHQKQKRITLKKRWVSPLLKLTRAQKQKRDQAILDALSKAVTQYSLNGRKIKTYSSMAAASRATGGNECYIGQCAKGRGLSSGGFIWKWEKETMPARPALITKRKKRANQKVKQLWDNGLRA